VTEKLVDAISLEGPAVTQRRPLVRFMLSPRGADSRKGPGDVASPGPSVSFPAR
jgi:hypothetical protein